MTTQAIPEAAAIPVEVRCGGCRSTGTVDVQVAYHLKQKRGGKKQLRRRFTAPASFRCTQCDTRFRLHLIEDVQGKITLAAGVKLV